MEARIHNDAMTVHLSGASMQQPYDIWAALYVHVFPQSGPATPCKIRRAETAEEQRTVSQRM